MPPFLFFWGFFFGVESWAAAHGLNRCAVCRLLSEPMSIRLLNSISSRICRQNTQFNMYTTTSKQQEGCTFKDSHLKCFITTNFDKFHREAFARGGESRWCFDRVFRDIYSQRSIRMEFVIILILFDVKDYRLLFGSIWLSPHRRKYTHDSQDFCKCSSVDVFGTKGRMHRYSLVWTALNRWCFKIC